MNATSRGRSEAFSDGVLAVAITLLVLNLHATASSGVSLASQLSDEWPSFLAYLLSFWVIGIIWVNHHALFSLVDRVDRKALLYNLLLLMFVTTVPFTTSTLAEFTHQHGASARIAVLIYGASMEGMAISYTLLFRHLMVNNLMRQPVSVADRRRAIWRFGLGALIYPIVTALGLLSPVVMLILLTVVSLYYVLDRTQVLDEEPEMDTSADG